MSFEKSVLTEGQKKKIWNLLEGACQIYLDLCHKRLQGNRFYRVEENSIVFNLFLVVETIYKLGKKYKFIKYDKKAKVLTPEKYQCVMIITDLRNDVYHNGKELSDGQLIKYMKQTLRLLGNSRNYTPQLEISPNEEVISSKSEEVPKDFEQEESVKAEELACRDDLKNTSQFLKGEKITFNLKEIKGYGTLLAATKYEGKVYKTTIKKVISIWVYLSSIKVEDKTFNNIKVTIEKIELPENSDRKSYLKVGQTLKFTIEKIMNSWIFFKKIWAEDQNPLELKQE